MASGSVGPTNAGPNQSAGGYYIVLSSLVGQANAYTAGTGSGGSWTQGSFSTMTFTASNESQVSSLINQHGIIRDMGKAEVSAGRTFKKFQAVGPQSSTTNGVFGAASGTGVNNTGYLTFYLEVPSDGTPAAVPRIARYA